MLCLFALCIVHRLLPVLWQGTTAWKISNHYDLCSVSAYLGINNRYRDFGADSVGVLRNIFGVVLMLYKNIKTQSQQALHHFQQGQRAFM